MVSDKNRLYIALYPSGISNNKERKYHWGFLIGPKIENQDQVPGICCHVKNRPVGGWIYSEEQLPDVRCISNLLARILIAKIEDDKRLLNILRTIPIIQDDPSWRCRTWIKNALAEMGRDGMAVGTSKLDWQKIEVTARKYVEDKTAAGRYEREVDLAKPRPTWDMIGNRESVP
ncbi:hypothetical protein QBC33DRAFT_442485 [Phialemonium atrogriseum]|uniref:Uncharacterized protein n=1 Tax=Phialemonium atrogriseum TaxID=1093897 RepID=A0AAJ0C9U3_9PEZI|nr:uncharacterized protein QBC33DRAFT_442485 [Phialemonium atrogriseum]KAK1772794.1 hypothetical protein QBC33DRAFT_442485 [Phialemonium atrogriseum]